MSQSINGAQQVGIGQSIVMCLNGRLIRQEGMVWHWSPKSTIFLILQSSLVGIGNQKYSYKLLLMIRIQSIVELKSMQKQTKIQLPAPAKKTKKIVKKARTGRWTPAESDQFQVLLQRYGKNWAKIHQNMKGRTLGQIRSHAQKYFIKLSQQKVLEYEARAKLIEAYQLLENKKRTQRKISRKQTKSQTFQVIERQECDLQSISENQVEINSTEMSESMARQSKMIKQQSAQNPMKEQNGQNPMKNQNFQERAYPFIQQNTSFLMYLIQQNLGAFFASNFRIEPFIDEPGFRAFTFKNI